MGPVDPAPAPARSLLALTPAQVAELLRQHGQEAITEDAVRADIEAGAPTNADGTLHLVHYGAWLARRVHHQGVPRAS